MTDTPPGLAIVAADLGRPEHARAIEALTDAYARDPFGRGAPLGEDTIARLIDGLRSTPTTFVWIAYLDGTPAGLATCFRGFSTFEARPLLNVHDLTVRPEFRGLGVGRALLGRVMAEAASMGCCRVTLEVQAGNTAARRLYERVGFSHALADTPGGGALFFVKTVTRDPAPPD